MKKLLVVLASFFSLYSNGQGIAELYNKKDYESVVKQEGNAEKLSPLELYMVGFSFFQLADDNKAIEFYDKALTKGLDSAYVHYYKALSLRYAKRYNESIKEFDNAIKKEPENQMYASEKGFAYYHSKQLDKALAVFSEAKKLPNTYYAPFYMVPHIYQMQKEYDKALTGFQESLNHIPKDNDYYAKTLADIGLIEFVIKKNYIKSSGAYSEAIKLNPKNYELYPKLIKAYNAAKEYTKADNIFSIMKTAYNNKELSADEMEFRNTAISEYQWNGQTVTVYKYFTDAKDVLDISYKVYLLDKSGDKVERTFMVEKTLDMPDTSKHLLCENDKKTGSHMTYPFGWETDSIPLEDLQKAVGLVLDGKMKPGASSKSGN